MTTNDSKHMTQHSGTPNITASAENSRHGNKWCIAIMLLLAVASAVAAVIGMSHHRKASDNAYAMAYLTPGGDFVLEGDHARQFRYNNAASSTLRGKRQDNSPKRSENTATAISSDGQVQLAAIADPTTRMIYLFAVDASSVPENATLNEFARRIAKSKNDVSVVAYTDATGSADHNLKLSDRRAAALGKYLISHGVDPKRVKVSGRGITHAFGSNSQNRRGELHF